MSIDCWWNDADRVNQTYWQNDLCQCHFIGFRFGNLLFKDYSNVSSPKGIIGAVRDLRTEHLIKG
jgi:hypothetical protein